ncbi:MAG: hypothetical protein VYE68_11900 [Acidobacteriota bacterium]|nr:hypothetical protein [Acidobacteriota bacterium]
MESLIVLVVVLVAVVVGVFLLRHVIVLAFRLAVLALLVIAGLWAWQHRADLVRLAEPYLSDAANELEALGLPTW